MSERGDYLFIYFEKISRGLIHYYSFAVRKLACTYIHNNNTCVICNRKQANNM